MRAAAALYAVGMDGSVLLRETDPEAVLFLYAVAEELDKLRALEREDQAVRIINNLSKALR